MNGVVRRFHLGWFLPWLLLSGVWAVPFLPQPTEAGFRGKKVIEFGWDIPDTKYLRENIRVMEEIPFDGVVLDVKIRDGRWLSWIVFGRQTVAYDEVRHAIEDLKTTEFRSFTDNFLRFNVTPGDVDWFDNDWAAIVHNAGIASRIIREGRLKGILLDVEQYSGQVFRYESRPHAARYSFEEYARKAKARGMELMREINRWSPVITILLTFGYELGLDRPGDSGVRPSLDYGLLPAFLDGLLAGSTPTTLLVDGWEFAYPYKRETAFREARKLVKEEGVRHSTEPEHYRNQYRVGFGLWVDYGWRRLGWDTTNFLMNFFTPEEFELALHNALTYSDEYVWVYSEQVNWWRRTNLPWEYLTALVTGRLARKQHRVITRIGKEMVPARVGRAREVPGTDDAATFGDLPSRCEEILTLPQRWAFRLDPDDRGRRERWYGGGKSGRTWREIEIGKWWEEQELYYDGVAWYRVEIPIPERVKGKRVFLVFGAVRDAAWVYVNDRPVGAHDEGHFGWDKRFSVEVTKTIRPGASNLVVVRVYNRAANGGIWKPVKLYASDGECR